MTNRFSRINTQLQSAYDRTGLSESSNQRRAVAKFAKQFHFVHFAAASSSTSQLSVIRGATASIDQQDRNICIGTHDGYDIAFVERTATTAFGTDPHYHPAVHRWHIMEFDLHSHSNLPFVFIGTKQQSRTFYAKLFSLHREVRHIDPSDYTRNPVHFGRHYSVITSPAEQQLLSQLLTEHITDTMAKHQQPFAIEIQNDSLFVITEVAQTSVQSLTKMLHYGLWLTKHIDTNIQ